MINFDRKSLSKENSHKFAKELLKRIYGGRYRKLKVDDRPDLKNLKQGFGVEVTRAVNGKKLTMLKEFLFGSLKDEELFTYKEKMLQEFEKETFDEIKFTMSNGKSFVICADDAEVDGYALVWSEDTDETITEK